MNKKVLILCNDFPPINSIGAERPFSWYLYFKEFGLHPIVITKNWTTNGNNVNPIVNENMKIENTEFGEIIRAANCRTLSIRFHDFFGNNYKSLRKLITLIEITFGFYFRPFDRHRNIYITANEYLKKNKVDYILATGEPFILLRYATILGRRYNVKSLIDFRDGWYLNHKFGITSKNQGINLNLIGRVERFINEKFTRNWELIIEKKAANLATAIITVDPEMAVRLGKLHNRKVHIIYNGFWEYYENSNQKKSKDKIIINHTGTLAPGQELELFLNVLLELFYGNVINENNFQFNLIGLEYFPDRMTRLNPYSELIGKIVFTTPRLNKEDAIKSNLNADYLILFTDPNLSAIYAKTYDYIACKKPILVVPGDKKLLDGLILNYNLGVVLENSDQIKHFISSVHKRLEPPLEVKDFTRIKQAENLAQLILKS